MLCSERNQRSRFSHWQRCLRPIDAGAATTATRGTGIDRYFNAGRSIITEHINGIWAFLQFLVVHGRVGGCRIDADSSSSGLCQLHWKSGQHLRVPYVSIAGSSTIGPYPIGPGKQRNGFGELGWILVSDWSIAGTNLQRPPQTPGQSGQLQRQIQRRMSVWNGPLSLFPFMDLSIYSCV